MWIILRVIIAIVFLAALQIYFIKKSRKTFLRIFPGTSTKTLKWFVWLFLIFINLYPIILISGMIYTAITHQSPTFPDSWVLDYFLIYPFWILFILTFQMVIYYLLFDVLKLVFYPLLRKNKDKVYKIESYLILILLMFFLIYVPARIIYDYNAVEVNEFYLTKQSLPEELNNFNIVFISDIQADRYTDDERLKNFIDKVNSENPDLVLIAGDVITSTPKYIDKAAKYIGKINAKYGVYTCVGDHDNWAYRQDNQRSIKEITDALNQYNVKMIDNNIEIISVGNSEMGITFITNTYVEKIPDTLLNKLTNFNNADLKIFLAHQPNKNLIETAARNNYDLFLAGHTHGGQITLLFPFIQLTPTLIETTFIRGEKYFGNTLAIVTRGLGMSLAPVRYNSTPEVVVIRLFNKN